MHTGDGGKPDYWRMYGERTVEVRRPSQWHDPGIFRKEKFEIRAFDREVMDHLNDHNAIYRDGALGGGQGLMRNNTDPFQRLLAGSSQGTVDAEAIIANLARDKNGNIVETLKVISHSMGGAYAKGYIYAILQYARENGIKGVRVDFNADFAPFQPDNQVTVDQTSVGGISMGDTFQYSHSKDKVAGNKAIKGAIQMDTSNDDNQGHSIFSFFDQISTLPAGKYKVVDGRIIPE